MRTYMLQPLKCDVDEIKPIHAASLNIYDWAIVHALRDQVTSEIHCSAANTSQQSFKVCQNSMVFVTSPCQVVNERPT